MNHVQLPSLCKQNKYKRKTNLFYVFAYNNGIKRVKKNYNAKKQQQQQNYTRTTHSHLYIFIRTKNLNSCIFSSL